VITLTGIIRNGAVVGKIMAIYYTRPLNDTHVVYVTIAIELKSDGTCGEAFTMAMYTFKNKTAFLGDWILIPSRHRLTEHYLAIAKALRYLHAKYYNKSDENYQPTAYPVLADVMEEVAGIFGTEHPEYDEEIEEAYVLALDWYCWRKLGRIVRALFKKVPWRMAGPLSILSVILGGVHKSKVGWPCTIVGVASCFAPWAIGIAVGFAATILCHYVRLKPSSHGECAIEKYSYLLYLSYGACAPTVAALLVLSYFVPQLHWARYAAAGLPILWVHWTASSPHWVLLQPMCTIGFRSLARPPRSLLGALFYYLYSGVYAVTDIAEALNEKGVPYDEEFLRSITPRGLAKHLYLCTLFYREMVRVWVKNFAYSPIPMATLYVTVYKDDRRSSLERQGSFGRTCLPNYARKYSI